MLVNMYVANQIISKRSALFKLHSAQKSSKLNQPAFVLVVPYLSYDYHLNFISFNIKFTNSDQHQIAMFVK